MREADEDSEPRNPDGERVSIDDRSDRVAAEREVAERHRAGERDPHHALNNPVAEPDPTEYPDPYERRPDPRDPASVDTAAVPADAEEEAEEDPAPRDPSTSDPHPPRNIDEARAGGSNPQGDAT